MIRRVLFALLAVGVLATGCSSSGGDEAAAPAKFQGGGLSPAQPRPSFTLTDTTGKSFSFAQLTSGHPTLLFFGYTNCPDICPTTMADIAAAMAKVPSAVAKKTYVVFVSTDVEHDTGPVIAKWLKNFATPNATLVGLRGTQAQINLAQAASHIFLAEDDGQTHSAQVLLYGPDNYARVQFLATATEAQQIAHDLPIVAGTATG